MLEEQLHWTSDCTSKSSVLLTSITMVSDRLCKGGGRCNKVLQHGWGNSPALCPGSPAEANTQFSPLQLQSTLLK